MKKLSLMEQVVEVFACEFKMDVSPSDATVLELRFPSPEKAKEFMHCYDSGRTEFVARAQARMQEPT